MYLTQGLHRAVQQHPTRIATICGDRKRTFAQVGERVAKLAGALRGLGLKTGDRAAVLALNSDRYLEYVLAVFWAGGVVNPVNTRWSDAEIVYSINDAGASILLVDDQFAPAAARFGSQCETVRQVIHGGEQATPESMHNYEAILDAAAPIEDVRRSGDELAGLFYTGGTTGFPKGVMLSHTNIWMGAMALVIQDVLPDGAIFLHAAPMFHIGDFALMIGQLTRGGTHVFIPSFTPVGLMEAVAKYQVTDMMLVPTMIQMWVDHPQIGDFDQSSARRVLFGAAPISEPLVERAQRVMPNISFMQAYGMTEAAPTITVNPPYYYSREGFKEGKSASQGRAAYTLEVRIVDEDDREVPRGEIGEIIMRGANVMKGYWNKPKETAEALRNGWLHSGDAGYMDADGFVFIVDRVKDMVISGGENIYSMEVENAIGKHPAVATCAVIGIPHEQWGEAVHAVVVRKAGIEIEPDGLIAHCKTLIAGYKCPRSIEFRDALPLNGAGKILKTALREPYWKDKKNKVV